MKNIQRSLCDLLGIDYLQSVCTARAALTGEDAAALLQTAKTPVDFYPQAFAARQDTLMQQCGGAMAPAFANSETGAPTDSYRAAQNNAASPLSAYGCFRIGEDGRIYYAAKSEHYHIPLGHAFPGYELLETAKRLGIPNATHNNTRGYITRLLERRLICAANGIADTDEALAPVLASRASGILNRVINLETGSLAVEAALKMMLARFYPLDNTVPIYEDKIPVFLVMADNAGGITAGYHGTTVFAQTLRGLWPTLREKIEGSEVYRIESVPINDAEAFAAAIEKFNSGPYKTAGFCHEIIMMNYGGIRLQESFLQAAYAACRASDTPTLCDEIQSCAWYGDLFLFRAYGLTPDFVSIGKGFPGGNYPASKILCSGAYDSMSQFGALVTNGQEELASLAYLITMEFIRANAEAVSTIGKYYHSTVRDMVKNFSSICPFVEGDAFMTAIGFHTVEQAVQFCKEMQQIYCIDISAQTYKPNCPPVALTKLPLITSPAMIDRLVACMQQCLQRL